MQGPARYEIVNSCTYSIVLNWLYILHNFTVLLDEITSAINLTMDMTILINSLSSVQT